ncbi:response regulator transcription factor [Microbacteriaceae bacterium K1510]|nr:response regulator transcription factor [Microbacteriaceae bacterium K1510]
MLVREALDSLIEGHSYRVVCGISSVDEVADVAVVGGGPKLVILGEQSIEAAIDGAAEIRKLWPDSRIVLLFEHASAHDVQRLLVSQIDGCVPLNVSPDTLIRALDVVMSGDGRVMILPSVRQCSIQPAIPDDAQLSAPGDMSPVKIVPASVSRAAINVAPHQLTIGAGTHGREPLRVSGPKSNGGGCASSRHLPRLSGREAQILDGLVRGQTNKVIARACDITEATVKVHMKSILRKIQVANRTQAAIWALEHGYSADEIKDRLLSAAEGI